MEGVLDTYPVRSELDAPLEVARWRPFLAWLAAIPHFAVLYALASVAGVVVVIAWFAILFTGRMPSGVFGLITLFLRYQWRTMTYAAGLYEPYPPFELRLDTEDDADSPATLDADEPDSLSRGLIWVKWLLAMPHFVALCFVYVAAFFAWGIGSLAVLVTGAWPAGIRELLVGTGRWTNRVTAYTYLLTDEYPPFSLR